MLSCATSVDPRWVYFKKEDTERERERERREGEREGERERERGRGRERERGGGERQTYIHTDRQIDR